MSKKLNAKTQRRRGAKGKKNFQNSNVALLTVLKGFGGQTLDSGSSLRLCAPAPLR
jgi:hypothetical protein